MGIRVTLNVLGLHSYRCMKILQRINFDIRWSEDEILTAGPGAPTTPWRPVGPGGPYKQEEADY